MRIWIGLLWAGLVWCPVRADERGAPTRTPLDFSLELQRPRTKVGEPIWVHMVLKNVSPAPLTVNARLLVNAPAPCEHEVVMKVTGPEGFKPFALLMRTGPPLSQSFLGLGPGRSYSNLFDLAQGYAIRRPGSYRIEAVYENRYPEAWVGRAAAPPLVVRVD